MLTLLGLLLAASSFVGLLDPNTKLGKKIHESKIISDNRFLKYALSYDLALKGTLLTLGFLSFILLSFLLDSYRSLAFISSLVVLGVITTFFASMISRTIRENLPLMTSFLGLGLASSMLFTLLHWGFNKGFDSGGFDEMYKTVSLSDTKDYLAFGIFENANEVRLKYEKELLVLADVNALKVMKKSFTFDIDLSIAPDTTKKIWSPVANSLKTNIRDPLITEKFYKYVENAIAAFPKAGTNGLKTPYLIDPYYLFSRIVNKYSRQFATVGIGGKLLIANLILQIKNSFGAIGTLILILIFLSVSLFATKQIVHYNKSAGGQGGSKATYFFVFVTVFGLGIAILSFVL